ELKEWTSNNWRKTATAKDSKDMKVNIAVIVEHMFRHRVNEMLCDLVGVEELGQDPQREFQLWNCAIKMVRKNLSPEEMDTFTERNTNFVSEMLWKFLQYIFYLHDIVCVAPNIGAATTVTGTGVEMLTPPEPPQPVVLETDSCGYPRLPKVFPGLTRDLVKLCCEYMNAQYSKPNNFTSFSYLMFVGIVSGKPDSRMCVAEVCTNPKAFIAGGCLPKDWDMTGNVGKNSTKRILWDPQNMDKGMLLDLLEHWRLQEKAHGCATALQFTHFMRGKEHLPTVIAPTYTYSAMVSPRKKPTMQALDMNSLLDNGSVTPKTANMVMEAGNENSRTVNVNQRPAHIASNEQSIGIQGAPTNRNTSTPPNSTTGEILTMQGHTINEGATETNTPPNKNMGTASTVLLTNGDVSTNANLATKHFRQPPVVPN
ncbi:hypothetical protein DXG01_007775, partial [Tephrocybe rancida]